MVWRNTGRYERVVVGGEDVSAFVPAPLPPSPPLILDDRLSQRLRQAEQALARLDLAGEMLPSPDWFIYAFVRKEAVISSQIEGTQATLVDLLAFEAEEKTTPNADVEEVCNYLNAITYARSQIADGQGLPLSMRLLNETHRRLMHGVRGAAKQPGEVRRSQNWIGGSRPGNAVFVPPPPVMLPELLGDFEKHLHGDDRLPKLVRAGLAHVQFETIHPYLDGNGRIGRLLISLLLEHWGLLAKPILYLSLFFKRHQAEYYRRLGAVRTEGDWEGWLDFFLDGVATIADEAVISARNIFALVEADRARVLGSATASVNAARLFEALTRHPIVTVASAMKLVDASKPTAIRAIKTLVNAGILVETTGKKRDRSFAYQAYIDRLRTETELVR
ncbi:MAG: cell filamentation protein Fic [Rhodospirillales bacterium RIFCSPLOWO2_12_FULL_58_28]|nr:MAG: cell filamentation protein Fic [Rhodospirillales bacterium RIFCSPLOWO2_02_FULL_58_16]OHC77661.1 MAG: cell filamentation protein Fic [Rhodospirillales bacterium RIFCSPLOWO2_12_FULL_58_28]